MIKCSDEMLAILPDVKRDFVIEMRTFLMFADAAEGQGDMTLAYEYDEKAKQSWCESNIMSNNGELEACYRRQASRLLTSGKPHEAVQILETVPATYNHLLLDIGISLTQFHVLEPIMAALKVLAAAYAQTGSAEHVVSARQILMDVEETETIVAGYWEGVLDETRQELT